MDVATSIAAMADDCAALVRHLQLPKVDIIGHSMGGMIAQECAVRHAELFDRVVLAATAPLNSGAQQQSLRDVGHALSGDRSRAVVSQPVLLGAVRGLLRQAGEHRYARAALRQVSVSAEHGGARRTVRALAAFDATKHLSSIRARTLVLAATDDLLFPIAASAAFAKAIPHASFVAVEGAAHSFPMEMPQEFTATRAGFPGVRAGALTDERSHRGRTANA